MFCRYGYFFSFSILNVNIISKKNWWFFLKKTIVIKTIFQIKSYNKKRLCRNPHFYWIWGWSVKCCRLYFFMSFVSLFDNCRLLLLFVPLNILFITLNILSKNRNKNGFLKNFLQNQRGFLQSKNNKRLLKWLFKIRWLIKIVLHPSSILFLIEFFDYLNYAFLLSCFLSCLYEPKIYIEKGLIN